MKQVFWCLISYWRQHKLQFVIAVFGVALGVAVVTAMDLANVSALSSFRQSLLSVTGHSTHQVVPGEGFYAAGVPEILFAKISNLPSVKAAAPIVEASGLLLAKPTTALGDAPGNDGIAVVRILGIDPLSDEPFRPFDGTKVQMGEHSFEDWILRDDGCVLPATLAKRLGLSVGDAVTVVSSSKRHALRLIGVYVAKDVLARGSDDVLLMDIAAAQERFGMPGKLNSIDLILAEGEASEKAQAEIRALLPAGVVLQRPAERAGRTEALLSAFQLNLTALSLLALVVGIFLIQNTLTVAVLQRLPMLGTLRCLGVSGSEVAGAVRIEAFLLGAVGSFFGLLAGCALAGVFLQRVGGIVSDLYTHIGAFSILYDPWALGKGAALGIVASLMGAYFPSREAGAIKPVQVLRRSRADSKAQSAWKKLAVYGLISFVLAIGLALVPGKSPVPGLGAAFAIAMGGALSSPAITQWISKAAVRPMSALFGSLGGIASKGIAANLSRSGLAVGALSLALSMTIGVALMVSSFRGTLDQWMEQAIHADIYIRPAGPSLLRHQVFLPEDTLEALRRNPDVEAVDTYRGRELTLANGAQVVVNATDMKISFLRGVARFPFAPPSNARKALEGMLSGGVIISESHARKQSMSIGDTVTLPGPNGGAALEVVGIYYEYATDRGVITMDSATYKKVFNDNRANSCALYLKKDVDLERFRDKLRKDIGIPNGLYIFSNRSLREEAFTVFDRTFVITGQLESLSLAVGLCGIVSALLAMLRERSADFALLRALGLPASGLFKLILLEGVLLGAVAFLIACVLGPALALLLIHVINLRAFGWTLNFAINAEVFIRVGLLALLMSALAGVYPSWRGRSMSISGALREE